MRRAWVLCLLTACGSDSGLSRSERALASEGLQSVEGEAALVELVERTFSGTIVYTPSDDGPASIHSAAELAVEGAQSTLGGCASVIRSPLDPADPTAVIEYTLTGCALDGHTLDGTLTSTWSFNEAIHVAHRLELTLDGAPTSGRFDLAVFRAFDLPGPDTRQRSYTLVTAGIQLTGAWMVAYDAQGCGTKTGQGTVAVETGRAFQRVDDLAFCSTETLPDVTGTVDLTRDGLALRVRLFDEGDADLITRGETFAVTAAELLD